MALGRPRIDSERPPGAWSENSAIDPADRSPGLLDAFCAIGSSLRYLALTLALAEALGVPHRGVLYLTQSLSLSLPLDAEFRLSSRLLPRLVEAGGEAFLAAEESAEVMPLREKAAWHGERPAVLGVALCFEKVGVE